MDGLRFRTEPWMASPNLPPPSKALSGFDVTRKVLSFGYLFFAPAKKSNSPKAKPLYARQGEGS
jgi:hypothetical protein